MSNKLHDRRRGDIVKKKKKFLSYYKNVPMIKFAAASIGMSEDTITVWRNADPDFSDQIESLKSKYVKSHLKDIKSNEWKMERIFRSDFSPRNELTGPDGGAIEVDIQDSILTTSKDRKSA